MVFLCYATSLVISCREYKIKNKKFFFPVLIIFLSYLIWSCYGYAKLGKFLNPFSLSSISGQTINIAYNEEFNKIYPEQSADILENYIFSKIKKRSIKNINEFEINEIFIKNSLEFIKENPKEVFFSYLQKIFNIFFNLKFDGKEKIDSEYNKIRYSNIPNKIFLNLMILIIIKNLITKTYKYKDFLCLTIILGYLFPYIIGFAYSRQIVPLYILAHFYVFFHIIQKCQIKKNY
jgi:hypothetical protein